MINLFNCLEAWLITINFIHNYGFQKIFPSYNRFSVYTSAVKMPTIANEKISFEVKFVQKILYLKTEWLESISDRLNPIRRDILFNLSDLLPIKDEEENNIINTLSLILILKDFFFSYWKILL